MTPLEEVRAMFPHAQPHEVWDRGFSCTEELDMAWLMEGTRIFWYCTIIQEKGDGSVVARGQGYSVRESVQEALIALQAQLNLGKELLAQLQEGVCPHT